MADYPATLPVAENLGDGVRDGRQIDITADGLARIRKLHDDRHEFVLTHPVLSPSVQSTLMAHYAAHETSSFTYTDPDGVAYTVGYAGRPVPKWHNGNRVKTYTVRLTQTA